MAAPRRFALQQQNKPAQLNKPTCKPGSVMDSHSSRTSVATCLKQPTRIQREPRHMNPYLVLLRVGFTLPLLLPTMRCALTAPFHPYRNWQKNQSRRSTLCCTGRRLTPPRRYLALCSMEPGLSSAALPKMKPLQRPPS